MIYYRIYEIEFGFNNEGRFCLPANQLRGEYNSIEEAERAIKKSGYPWNFAIIPIVKIEEKK